MNTSGHVRQSPHDSLAGGGDMGALMRSTEWSRTPFGPVAEWPQALPANGLPSIKSELAALIQRATLLHDYIATRYNTGCGDKGHAASAKHANATLVRVRKAMGFSYPKNVPFTIQ